MHRLPALLAVFTAIAGLPAPIEATAAQGLKLSDILERNAKVMGGRGRLDRLESVVTLRTPTSLTSLKLPHFVLVEGFDSAGAVAYAEGYNGQHAWEQTRGDTARRVVTGRAEVALRRVVQWPGNVLTLYRLADFGHSLELEGSEQIDSVMYFRIRLTLNDGFTRWYFLNARTFLIERARDTRELHANDGNTREIETVFSDYRLVDGYRFPFTVFERDVRTGERLFGRTVLAIFPNAEIPDSLFDSKANSDLSRLHMFRSKASRSPEPR